MKYNVEFRGTCETIGLLGPLIYPNEAEILAFLDNYRYNSGAFYIDIINPSKNGPRNLQIQSDIVDSTRLYFLMMGDDFDEYGTNKETRTALNRKNSDKTVEFFGNYWNHRELVDFNYMKEVVFQFVEIGDVSRSLLN